MTADIDIKTEPYDVWESKSKEAIAMVAGVQSRSLSATIGLGGALGYIDRRWRERPLPSLGSRYHSQDARSGVELRPLRPDRLFCTDF